MKKSILLLALLTLFLPVCLLHAEDEAPPPAQSNPEDNSFDQSVEKMAREQEEQRANPIAPSTVFGYSVPALFGAIIFSSLGLYGFLQGRKRQSAKYYALGIALMSYTYVIKNAILIFVIGGILVFFLFWKRD